MVIKVNKLKGKVVENGLKGKEIAKAIGIDPATYYRKLKIGGGSFTVEEVQNLVKVLHLSTSERDDIFFNNNLA